MQYANSTPLLQVDHLAFGYHGALAVSDVSLRVNPGSVVALLGSNGAGKTTTAKIIAGALQAQRGELFFAGESISRLRSHDVVQRGITLVPEGRLVFPAMTVMENLRLGAYSKRARADLSANLDRVFQIFPRLAERRSQLAGIMSGGEQQMLAIARGLMASPRLMILDEPSLGLMPIMVEKVFELVAEIKKSDVSLIIVEQNVHQALAASDYGFVLEKGRVTKEGTSDELLKDDFVRRAFLGH